MLGKDAFPKNAHGLHSGYSSGYLLGFSLVPRPPPSSLHGFERKSGWRPGTRLTQLQQKVVSRPRPDWVMLTKAKYGHAVCTLQVHPTTSSFPPFLLT